MSPEQRKTLLPHRQRNGWPLIRGITRLPPLARGGSAGGAAAVHAASIRASSSSAWVSHHAPGYQFPPSVSCGGGVPNRRTSSCARRQLLIRTAPRGAARSVERLGSLPVGVGELAVLSFDPPAHASSRVINPPRSRPSPRAWCRSRRSRADP